MAAFCGESGNLTKRQQSVREGRNCPVKSAYALCDAREDVRLIYPGDKTGVRLDLARAIDALEGVS
jgi:hypothetical protein